MDIANESMTLQEMIERGYGMNEGDYSFRNRIALQFLNDFPSH